MAVVKMGNRVVLGDGLSYIEDKATGETVLLTESGWTCVFEVEGKPLVANKSVGFARPQGGGVRPGPNDKQGGGQRLQVLRKQQQKR